MARVHVAWLSHRVYNVGSGEIISAADVAAAINSAMPRARVRAEAVPGAAPRVLDTTLARRDLGYESRWPLARAIPDLVQELRQLEP